MKAKKSNIKQKIKNPSGNPKIKNKAKRKKNRLSDSNSQAWWKVDKNTALLLGGLLVLTFLAFSPTFSNNFTNWDDDLYVTENPNINVSGEEWSNLFTVPVAANIHPVTMASLVLDFKLTGEEEGLKDATIYHAQSLFWHLLNVVLVFYFMFLISGRNGIIAIITAAIFALHPMHVESVAWVSGRKDVLYTFFFFASLLAYLRYREKQKILPFALAILFYILSLASKPAAVILPVLMLMLDLFDKQRLVFNKKKLGMLGLDVLIIGVLAIYGYKIADISEKIGLEIPSTAFFLMNIVLIAALVFVAFKRKFAERVWIEKVPFFLLSGMTGALTFYSQGTTSALDGGQIFGTLDKFFFGSFSFVVYIYKFFVPINMASFHPYPIEKNGDFSLAINYMAPLVVALVLALGVYSFFKSKRKILAWSIGFFLITIGLVLQFITVGSAITAERYTYVPYIGFGFLLAAFYYYYFHQKNGKLKKFKPVAMGTLGVFGVLLAVLTFMRTLVWESSITLWSDVIEQYDYDSGSFNNRGHAYRTLSDNYNPNLPTAKEKNPEKWNEYLDNALSDYQNAIKLKPKNAKAFSNMGMIFFRRNQDDKALEAYNKAIELDDSFFEALSNRGAIHARNGRYEPGLKDLDKCIELKPSHKEAYINRAILHAEQSRKYQSQGNLTKSLSENEAAVPDFLKCLEFNPVNHNVMNSLGVCYQSMAQVSTQIATYYQQNNQPEQSQKFQQNVAKNYKMSIDYFSRASQVNPRNSSYVLNRSYSYFGMGDKANALKDAMKAKSLGAKLNQEYLQKIQ